MSIRSHVRMYLGWLLLLMAMTFAACVIGGNPDPKCQSDTDCPTGSICQGTICLKLNREPQPKPDATETVTPPDRRQPPEPPPQDQDVPEQPPELPLDGSPDDPQPQCIDKDNDGYCENIPGPKGQIDCDDNDKDVYPGNTEVCDGKDNDCSGTPDDKLGQPPLCPKQQGVCKGARHTACDGANGWKPCEDGSYAAFSSDYEDQESRCDGKDNDCNGKTDESFSDKGLACLASGKQGECARGTYESCVRGKPVCRATTQPKTEVCNNGKDDDCDGKTDESPPCYCKAGDSEPCYNNPIGCTKSGNSYNCKGTCKAGTRTCKADNTWGACQGDTGPSSEICDGKDNDCDGQTDETYPERGKACTDAAKKGECAKGTYTACTSGQLVCTTTATPKREECGNSKDDDCDGAVDEADCSLDYPVSASIVDYAVRSNNTALVLHSLNSTSVKLTCFGSDGKAKTPVVTITKAGYRLEYAAIATAPGATDVNVVSWVERTTTSSSSRQFYSRLYNSNCAPLSATFTWPPVASNAYVFDVAVDGSGNIAVVYKKGNEPAISFYDKTGKQLGTEQLVDPEKKYCQGTGYGIQVAMNAAGAGVVTCQDRTNDPIAYRRFGASRALAGTTMTPLAQTLNNNNSSYNRSHATNINDQGVIAIQWQSNAKGEDQAILINPNGGVIRHWVLGQNVGNGYEGFSYSGQRVERYNNDFIFRDSNTSTSSSTTRAWYRYDATGKLQAVAKGNYRGYLLRMTGTTNFVSNGTVLTRNALDFGTGQGVCSGKPCVCEPKSTRACYFGGGSARAPCKNGSQTCANDGLSWGPCVGQILPKPEICGNNTDDDCDGRADENCPHSGIQPIGVSDYAVAGDGSIVTIHWNGKVLYGSCFGPNGSVTKSFFQISQQDHYARNPSVRMALTSKRFVVSWFDQVSSQTSSGYWTSMLFNGSCTSISQPIRWNRTATNSNSTHDIAINEQGAFVTAFRNTNSGQPLLNFYNSSGVPLKVEVQGATTNCNSINSAIHLALHPSNGTGVFSCERSTRGPVYYRRFTTNGTFTDNSEVMITGSDQNRGSYYHSHILGMNSKGEFAIQWQDRTNDVFYANIYSSSGSLIKSQTLSSRMSSDRDAFDFVHQKVELLGDDFIFRDGGETSTTPNWYRFDSTGKPVAAYIGDNSLSRHTLRTDGTNTYVVSGALILTNKVDLKAGSGLCNGQICVCTPNAKESCYSGGSGTPRTPCKAGTRTCASNGLSWGPCTGQVLPQPETCGNSIDDDCDGTVDDNCPKTNKVEVPGGLDDYDVANDGSIVAIKWSGTGLLAHCFNADLTVKKGGIQVSAFGRTASEPMVRMAKVSKHFLVIWRDGSSNASKGFLTGRLYNSACSPASSQFTIYNKEINHYDYDFAIDDNGNSVVLWKDENRQKAYLAFFDNKGIRQGSQSDVDPGGSYCRSSYGFHVAINPQTRAGVVTCQQYYTSPIYYRLFSATRVLNGTGMTAIANMTRASGFNRSHIVGMNRRGEFVIYWQNYSSRQYEAAFYNATGTLTKRLTGSTTMSPSHDSFREIRENVELIGNDFVARDGGYSGSPVTWYRYTPAGTQAATAAMPSTSYDRYSLRIGGTTLFVRNGNFIEVGTIKFP